MKPFGKKVQIKLTHYMSCPLIFSSFLSISMAELDIGSASAVVINDRDIHKLHFARFPFKRVSLSGIGAE